MTRSALYWK